MTTPFLLAVLLACVGSQDASVDLAHHFHRRAPAPAGLDLAAAAAEARDAAGRVVRVRRAEDGAVVATLSAPAAAPADDAGRAFRVLPGGSGFAAAPVAVACDGSAFVVTATGAAPDPEVATTVTFTAADVDALARGEVPEGSPATVRPAPRDGAWPERFEAQLAAARRGGHEVAFLGDSITEGWTAAGREAWARYDGKALGLGISGDRTAHVLHRLDHGLLDALGGDGSAVRAVVLMIGTNDSGGETGEAIASGVAAIVDRLRTRVPRARVLLLAIFPRGTPDDPRRATIQRANRLIATLADGDRVRFLDIGGTFLAKDGTLPGSVMPDALHLSPEGYRLWADAIEAPLAALRADPVSGPR